MGKRENQCKTSALIIFDIRSNFSFLFIERSWRRFSNCCIEKLTMPARLFLLWERLSSPAGPPLSVQEARPLADWGLSRRVDRSWWLKLPRVLTMDGAHDIMNKQILFFLCFYLLSPLNSFDLDRSQMKYVTAKAGPVQGVQQKCLEWICFILWINESFVDQGLLW